MAMLVYNLIFPLVFLLYLPFYAIHLARRGGLDRFFWERLGVYTRERKAALRRLRNPVWIHAVSVGEVVAAAGFIRRWRERCPDLEVVLSTTTTTGHALAAQKLPAEVVLIYCPVDLRPVVKRVLGLASPRMLIIFEVEYWPNLICLASRRGIPVILANGRMSDKSAAGYVKHAWFFRPLFERFKLFCMQSPADVERVRRVVGDAVPVEVCNTMKFDQVPDCGHADRQELLDRVFGSSPRLIWTAGSTHANEEALVADTFKSLKADFPELKLVLVPRHHERTAEVQRILDERQLSYRLLTACQPGPGPAEVLLVNTTGELMAFYGVSDLVYVGKSLAGCTGGHNIIEPAIFGKPIVHGCNMQNFRLVTDLFRQAGASVEVESDGELADAIRQLCKDRGGRDELGRKARRVVEASRGAIDRTLAMLEQF